MIKAITPIELENPENDFIKNRIDEFITTINHFLALKNYNDCTESYFTINLYSVCNKIHYSWGVLTPEVLKAIEDRYIEAGWNCKAGDCYYSGPYKGIKFFK